MSMSQTGRWFFLLLGAVVLMLPSASHAAGGPTFSIRYFGGVEGELHLSKVGLMYGQYGDSSIKDNGVDCGGTYHHAFVAGRFFFKGPKDSWYLGLINHSRTILTTGTCTAKAQEKYQGSGLGLMGGYHWLWGSGFNVDLGVRPGFLGASILGLAIGISF